MAGASGCATKVLGPGDATNPYGFLIATLIARQPTNVGQGPAVGAAATQEDVLYRAIHQAVAYHAPTRARWKKVYVAGWGEAPSELQVEERSPGAEARRGSGRLAWRRGVARFVANEAAHELLRGRAQVTDDPRDADFWLIPWVELAAGQTTERQYRVYGYPVYYHYEDHREARVGLLLYDPRTKETIDLSTGRNRQVAIESYILDIFGFRFEL